MSFAPISFRGQTVRVFGTPEAPLFVAADVCAVIGRNINPSVAVASLPDYCLAKVTIEQENPRSCAGSDDPIFNIGSSKEKSSTIKKEVNALTEAGLYALVMRSRSALKEGTPAYDFLRQVTTEILPSIRKTGSYVAYISDAQAREIQRAVARRAKKVSGNYPIIWRAVKDRFEVPSYRHIRAADFEDALRFVKSEKFQLLAEKKEPEAAPQPPAEGAFLSGEECASLLRFIYYMRFLFVDHFIEFGEMLCRVQSPLAGGFYDAMHEVDWKRMIKMLAKHGYDIRDMRCYQAWLAAHGRA